MSQPTKELKNTTYELFIAALSLLSIFNLALTIFLPQTYVAQVAAIMDLFLSLIFISDFLYRFFTAESKSAYFFRQFGWADLLGSLPFPRAKVLRLFRVFRAVRLMRKYGAANMLRDFLADRAGSALLSLFFLIILVLEFGGMAMYAVEIRAADGNIKSASDSIWYTFVTITTVGYGDRYPVTNLGRAIGMVIMMSGVGLFGTLTGYLSNAFLGGGKEEPVSAPLPTEAGTPEADTPEARLAQLRALLQHQQDLLAQQEQAQSALTAKLTDIEKLIAS
jgi:voltage-gated potassium channel